TNEVVPGSCATRKLISTICLDDFLTHWIGARSIGPNCGASDGFGTTAHPIADSRWSVLANAAPRKRNASSLHTPSRISPQVDGLSSLALHFDSCLRCVA